MKIKILVLFYLCFWVNIGLFSQDSDICYVYPFKYANVDVKDRVPKGFDGKLNTMRDMFEVALNNAAKSIGLNTVFIFQSYTGELESNRIETRIDELNGDIVMMSKSYRVVKTIKGPVKSIVPPCKIVVPISVLNETSSRIDTLMNGFAHRFVIEIKDSENKEKLKKEFELLDKRPDYQELKKVCGRIERYLNELSSDSVRNNFLILSDEIESYSDKRKRCNK